MKRIITILFLFLLILSGCTTHQIKTSDNQISGTLAYQKPAAPSLVLEASQTSPRLPTESILDEAKDIERSEIAKVKEVNPQELHANNDSFLARITGYIKKGVASWYGPGFHGRKTANGETFNMYEMTAAHKTLPIPSYAEVTNLTNNKKVIVKINDRGPYVGNRVLDLSYAAAKKLGISGTGKVEIKAVSPLQALPQIQKTAENSNKNVYLEVGAFGNSKKAKKLQDKIAANNLPTPVILKSKRSKNTLYKVQMGPIKSPKNAELLSYHLAKIGIKDPEIVVAAKQN